MTTNRKTRRMPIVGCAWDPEQRNPSENLAEMASELEFYRPRGFAKLRDEMKQLAQEGDPGGFGHEIENEAADLLTEWARRRLGHDYIYWIRDGGFAGFLYDVESAMGNADWVQDDSWRGRWDKIPPRAYGLLVHISDHGNVTLYRVACGRRTELFAAV